MSNTFSVPIIVYVGGRVVGNSNNPTYEGGRPILLEVRRDSSLASLQHLIQNVAATPPGLMKITYCYPIVSHPHPISYIGVEVVDDGGVNTIFSVANDTPGYTPTLYVESVENFPNQYDTVPVHTSSRRRSKGESSRHRQSIINDMPNSADERNEAEEDYLIGDQHEYEATGYNDECEHGNDEFEHGDDEDADYSSNSSEEDVDAGLKAGDDDEDATDVFEPPSMLTQDTWTNIIDPSPPMPTGSQIGRDGSDFIRGQIFSSKEEVKYSVQKYSMRRNCAVKAERSSPTVLVYRCNNEEPCQWRLRAVKNIDTEEWEITRYAGPHTCVSRNVSQDHANLTARYMVRHITTILKKDASTKIKVLQEIIKIATESFNPSYAKTWAAKTLAIGDIYGNWDESYAELPRYLAAVKVRNPGTEYVINTTESNIPRCAIFIRVFWAFGPAIEAFKHCRPVLSVDGTFLTGKYKAVMLIAVSQDAENECVPIAFAIVEKEDVENWGWFLNCIRCFVTMRKNLCLISNRAAGLMSYMPTDHLWRPPYVYHRYCARHIGANFMKRYNKKVDIQVKVTAMEV
ncbi:hypothetical protein Vadar_024154 [Vaccinium darrowii]|uniref:Uncharacterized protein n=1 Tax=Vaccinium darrowii TaxID=229202 RepID=A0ACB7XCH2_9ERIC|nr:hypothetical protein Vadar_024154 [Vaccinium darrowii]